MHTKDNLSHTSFGVDVGEALSAGLPRQAAGGDGKLAGDVRTLHRRARAQAG